MADEPKVDSVADSSPAVVEKPEGPEDEFALPEDVKDEKSRARFQKLVDRAKAAEGAVAGYQALGTPEQLTEFVEYTRGLEANLESMQARIKQLEGQREPGEPKTAEQKKLEADSQGIRAQMRQHEPLLEKAEKFIEQAEKREALERQALFEDAFEITRELMTTGTAKPSDREVNRRGRIYEAIISEDPALAARFRRSPERVIKRAHEIYLKESRSVAESEMRLESQRAKERTVALPRAHGGGGGPGTSKPSEPAKSIGEGMARAMSRWRERG